jgi:V/A-type H+-transporting ATPase subunit K
MILDPESLATLGGAIALAGGLVGSAIGIAIAGTAGVAILSRDPRQLRNVIVLASIPMSQTFYGLIILILILTTIVPKISTLPEGSGFNVFACGIVPAITFCLSAAYKGRVCASGISLLPRTKGRILTSSLMLAVFVELIAVLGLVFTMMALSIMELM